MDLFYYFIVMDINKIDIILINYDIHLNIMLKIFIHVIIFFYICNKYSFNKCFEKKTLRT